MRTSTTKSTTTNPFWDGFFSFFGLIDLSEDERVREIMDTKSEEKIKSDIRKITVDYRKAYKRIQKEVLHLDY